MAELIAGLAEALMALVELVATWAHALISGLVVLLCFAFSSRFRARRREEWQKQPGKKIADFVAAGVWLVIVVGLPCFFLLPRPERPKAGVTGGVYLARGHTNAGLRLDFLDTGTNKELRVGFSERGTTGRTNGGYVAIKKDGLTKILGTKSLKELKTQFVENVSYHPAPATNAP